MYFQILLIVDFGVTGVIFDHCTMQGLQLYIIIIIKKIYYFYIYILQ